MSKKNYFSKINTNIEKKKKIQKETLEIIEVWTSCNSQQEILVL